MTTPPTQPPEGELIETARARRVPPTSVNKLAKIVGITGPRWRQIEKGHSSRSGRIVPERAKAETLARMAQAVSVTPEELREVGRDDAADYYERMLRADDDAPLLDSTEFEVEGFEALELALKGTPPENRQLALRVALKAVEAFQQETGSQPNNPGTDA